MKRIAELQMRIGPTFLPNTMIALLIYWSLRFDYNFRSKSCKRDLWNKIEQSEKQENARANSQTEMKNSFKF